MKDHVKKFHASPVDQPSWADKRGAPIDDDARDNHEATESPTQTQSDPLIHTISPGDYVDIATAEAQQDASSAPPQPTYVPHQDISMGEYTLPFDYITNWDVPGTNVNFFQDEYVAAGLDLLYPGDNLEDSVVDNIEFWTG
ncbi:hypothetical protein PVAG01_06454 [Phlyctema vagabunda]|uniref:Uncharacterized protein n=1 Tax=Phlyctema vagabunda TaxID=108571 RepID=A0ABR4PG50_9HELO